MSRLRRKSWEKVASTAAALALVSSFLLASGGVASAGETITLYNGQHEQTTDALVAGFEKATGINVEVRNDDEDTLVSQIETEGSKSPADLFYTENSLPLVALQDKGLLAPVDPKTLAQTPSKYNSSGGDWEGVSARVSVLIYNPKLISKSQLPTTVLGLADPKYKGKLAFAAGETDFQPIVTSVIKAYGTAKATAWLKGIKANSGSHTYPDNETITDEVNRGAVAFGVINQYYWYRLGSEIGASGVHSKITYFAPHDPGYVLDVSGAGILKSSTHQAAAQKFLAYLTSKAGQTILAHSISWEYPIASGVTRTGETPFTQLQPNPITVTQLGNGAAAVALLQKAGLL
jgi:iron(III) transport system substrate-binding protein